MQTLKINSSVTFFNSVNHCKVVAGVLKKKDIQLAKFVHFSMHFQLLLFYKAQ